MSFRSGFFIVFILFTCCTPALSSDTLAVTLRQADSIFLANNYQLLAASMNIEAQKAQIIQARLYANPIFTADLNVYDPQNQKALHIGPTGQKVFQLEQLISISGKRKAEIELAKANADIAALEFEDLVRQLKFKLHRSLFALGQQLFLLNRYGTQLALLDTIMTGYEVQIQKGNMPLKDLVRLKGVYLSLNNDRAELLKEYFQTQTDIQTLLQVDQHIAFLFSDTDISSYIKAGNEEDLLLTARVRNPFLQMARENETIAQARLQLQKRAALPDVNIFTSYDQRGGAFDNQINAGLSVPLPAWNRNQGNIKTAHYQLKEAAYLLNAREQQLLSEIRNDYQLYLHTVKEYEKASRLYNDDFELTLKGISDNFQRRNISLLEFVDFFEAYNEAIAELARIKIELVTSAELLNLKIGVDVF